MLEGYKLLKVSKEDNIAIVQLERPQALNALNRELLKELSSALDELELDESVRVVIITGSGGNFSAGADVKEFGTVTVKEAITSYFTIPYWDRVRRFPKPLIAAVEGVAAGGGLELAMSCDLIVASENARLGQPEINLGLIPGAGGTQVLPKVVGKFRAMQMVLLGDLIPAREAERIGLVNKVVPPESLLEEAKKLARELAKRPPLALRLAKETVLASMETGLSEGLLMERKNFLALLQTKDAAEGVKAFLEKRKPEFKGE